MVTIIIKKYVYCLVLVCIKFDRNITKQGVFFLSLNAYPCIIVNVLCSADNDRIFSQRMVQRLDGTTLRGSMAE